MRINVPFTSRSSSCRRKSAVVVGGGDGGGGCAVAVVAAASPAAAPASAPAVLVLLLLPLMPLVVVVIVAVSQLFKLECLLSCQLLELRLLLMSSKTGVFVVASRSLSLSLFLSISSLLHYVHYVVLSLLCLGLLLIACLRSWCCS